MVVGWQYTMEMPAVPINHSPLVIDSANVVWRRQRKLEGINHGPPKTLQPFSEAGKGHHCN